MRRAMLLTAGSLALALGAAGLFLPVLPTTPFVILAALCYSASSQKMHAWLTNNSFFGPYIENYRTKQGVPVKVKAVSIASLWAMLVLSALLVRRLWIVLLLSVVGVAVSVHLLMLKTKQR